MLLDYYAAEGQIDRRSHTRVGVDLFSLYSEREHLAPGRVYDLSLSGLRLEADSDLMLESELDLLLKLDFKGSSRHMRVHGQVVRELPQEGNHPQYGVAFSGLSSHDRQLVDEYLAARMGMHDGAIPAGVAS